MSGRSKFVAKLHSALENPVDADSLRWASDNTFLVTMDDAKAIAALRDTFEFGSLNSFLRQLSYYNFKRVSDRRRGGEVQDGPSDQIVFTHPSGFFVRGDVSQLDSIKRQPKKPKGAKRERRQSVSSSSTVDSGESTGFDATFAGADNSQSAWRVAHGASPGPSTFSTTFSLVAESGRPIMLGSQSRSLSSPNLPRQSRQSDLGAQALTQHPMYSNNAETAGEIQPRWGFTPWAGYHQMEARDMLEPKRVRHAGGSQLSSRPLMDFAANLLATYQSGRAGQEMGDPRKALAVAEPLVDRLREWLPDEGDYSSAIYQHVSPAAQHPDPVSQSQSVKQGNWDTQAFATWADRSQHQPALAYQQPHNSAQWEATAPPQGHNLSGEMASGLLADAWRARYGGPDSYSAEPAANDLDAGAPLQRSATYDFHQSRYHHDTHVWPP